MEVRLINSGEVTAFRETMLTTFGNDLEGDPPCSLRSTSDQPQLAPESCAAPRAGLVRGEPAAIATADRLFGSAIAPWCPEIF